MILRLTIVLTLITFTAQAQPAQRDAGKAWQEAASSTMGYSAPPAGSALAAATELRPGLLPLTDTAKTFPWPGSLEEMQKAFELARDSRVIPWRADFARRPSWLYPDDGCYARAVVAADTLKRAGLPVPGKIFAFGNLATRTHRSPRGSVSWWYHVAIAYRHASGVYVLDPSVEESRPLKMEDWLEKIGGVQAGMKISFCDTKTYTPADNCLHGSIFTTTSGFRDQALYLDLEWERLLLLGKNPTSMLGEQPLWQ